MQVESRASASTHAPIVAQKVLLKHLHLCVRTVLKDVSVKLHVNRYRRASVGANRRINDPTVPAKKQGMGFKLAKITINDNAHVVESKRY